MVAEFYDSSAFTKLFLKESGTAFVKLRYANANQRTLSRLASTEVLSAFARAERERVFTAATATAARVALRAEVQQCTIISITENIMVAAEFLLQKHTLRTLDALQLASALEANGVQPTYFVAADKRLIQVAYAVGLSVIDVNRHP